MPESPSQQVHDVEQTPHAEGSKDFFRAERDVAREQINAAWQLQVEQVQEQLERGWRDHVARALDERFDALRASAEEEVERRVLLRLAAETERARAHAARQTSERLNQSARRLDQAEDLSAWSAALLDGAAYVGRRIWLFSVLSGKLNLEGSRAVADSEAVAEPQAELIVDMTEAPAFQTVLESMDTVIAMGTPSELGEAIAGLSPEAVADGDERRVCLLPVIVGQTERQRRVAAVLLVDGSAGSLEGPLDVNELEVLAALAGGSLDARQAAQRVTTVVPAGGLIPLGAAVESKPAAGTPPDWQSLSKDEQEVHARAQRFARVRVAEMRLYQAEAVRNGREQARLYMALRGEMDRSRAQFKHEYMHSPTMVDYFHMEVLRTLANDDASLLGPEYPGPLL